MLFITGGGGGGGGGEVHKAQSELARAHRIDSLRRMKEDRRKEGRKGIRSETVFFVDKPARQGHPGGKK